MIHPAISRPLSVFLAALIAAPYLAAQNPPAPQPAGQVNPAAVQAQPNPVPTSQTPPPPATNAPFSRQQLSVVALEGDKVINSIPTLQATAPVVEVRDANDFPVEGADVVFTLPSSGSAGTFARGGLTYATRTDSSGQATAPPVVPKSAGKFEITVTATMGNRTGETKITQTNSTSTHIAAEAAPTAGGKPFYKRKLFWIATGAAVGGIVAAVLLTGSSSTVTVTPGTPVFH